SKSFIGKLGVGIGGKLVFPADGTNSKFADTIASVTFIALNWLQCSFTADNLIASDDARARGFYREFVLGTKVSILGIMFVYADPHYAMDVPNTNTPWGYEAGVEFPFFSSIFLRGGVFQNSKIDFMNQYGDGFSVGLGWMAPKISLDYSFRRIINPSLAMGHVFGATVFF
ncbi:MAG: hypothetical protein ACXWP5_16300, partial [Bdellovibrionota bacterium]